MPKPYLDQDSRIGVPLEKPESIDKYQWKKGDDMMGFILPCNCIGSVQDIFNRFQLWQNTNGICVPGRELNDILDDGRHIIHKRSNITMLSRIPFHVGDMLNGVPIVFCRNKYYSRLKMWRCVPIFGKLPQPTNIPIEGEEFQTVVFFQNVLNTLKCFRESMCDFIDNYDKEMVKTAKASTSTPWNVAGGIAPPTGGPVAGGMTVGASISEPLVTTGDMESMKQRFKDSLQEDFDKLEESILC